MSEQEQVPELEETESVEAAVDTESVEAETADAPVAAENAPDESTVSPLEEFKAKLRRQIGTVFQDFRLLPSKTVYENVALAMQVIGKPRHAIETAVPDALELVGLSGKESRLPHELSGGEVQRVAIARSMVNRPELLLADEPTGNLDPETSLGIMRLLDRINRTGTTVVMATHDADIVNQMRKRVIELANGDVVRDQNRGVYGAGR